MGHGACSFGLDVCEKTGGAPTGGHLGGGLIAAA